MLSLRTIARRAPALALAATYSCRRLGPRAPHLLRATRDLGLRVPSGLLLILALIYSAVGPAASARADAPNEPIARVQLVIKQFEILDDRDGMFAGKGDLHYSTHIWRCPEWAPLPCDGYYGTGPAWMIASAYGEFSASTGDIRTEDRLVPRDGDPVHREVSESLGFPIYAGYRYVVQFEMFDDDGDRGQDNMGKVFHFLGGDRGLTIGTHVGRATGAGGGHVGDYIVTYEVRGVPLPDLRPVSMTVGDVAGSTQKRVCVGVQNVEAGAAGPFEVTLVVDTTMRPGVQGTGRGPAPGSHEDVCFEAELPQAGEHRIKAVVDPSRAVPEFNEANNVYELAYTAPSQAASTPSVQESTGKTATAPGAAQTDLTVGSIKVNGQVPDGKDDCKDGKNRVTVVVKNTGTAHAASFAVRLDVDGQQQDEALLSGLVAGQEQEVRFEDVRLKKGTHALTVVADQNKALAEANDGNNELKVTAQCKDAS